MGLPEVGESFVGEFDEAFGEQPSERHFDVVFVAVFERFEAVEDEEKVVELDIKVEKANEAGADGEFVFGFQQRFDFLTKEVRFVVFDGFAETGDESVDRAPVVEELDLRIKAFKHFFVGQASDKKAASEDFFDGDRFGFQEFVEVGGRDYFDELTDFWDADTENWTFARNAARDEFAIIIVYNRNEFSAKRIDWSLTAHSYIIANSLLLATFGSAVDSAVRRGFSMRFIGQSHDVDKT